MHRGSHLPHAVKSIAFVHVVSDRIHLSVFTSVLCSQQTIVLSHFVPAVSISSMDRVSEAEKAQVRDILARMEKNGQVLSPRVVSLPVAMGTMSDASKRQRSNPESDFEDELQAPLTPCIDDFQVVSPAPNTPKSRHPKGTKPTSLTMSAGSAGYVVEPTAKPKATPCYDGTLPPGVKTLSHWGQTIGTLQKVKADEPTYAEIATSEKYKSYRFWMFHQGKGIKSGRMDDLRAYLCAVGVDESGSGEAIPGTEEIRRFKEG